MPVLLPSARVKPATLQDYKARILRVLLHVQRHLDEPLRLEALARIACFSPCHFHRIFSGMTGESLHEHVRRLRLERAAGQLKLSSRAVTSIAFDAGFETHEAFTRAFKGAYGLAPSRFRARESALPAAAPPSGVRFRKNGARHQFKAAPLGDKTMNVQIKKLKPLRVAFVRHVGPYHEVGVAWDKLMMILGKDGRLGGGATMLGICHDDPDVTPPDKIRYDACVSVDETFQASGEIGVDTVAGGDYAVTTHLGPYDRVSEVYRKLLGQWLPRSGRELRDAPCFEVYLNSPESTEPEDLITDIYAPLRPARRVMPD